MRHQAPFPQGTQSKPASLWVTREVFLHAVEFQRVLQALEAGLGLGAGLAPADRRGEAVGSGQLLEVDARVHTLHLAGKTPPPEPGPKCRNCSLVDLCKPEAIASQNRASQYLTRLLQSLAREEQA